MRYAGWVLKGLFALLVFLFLDYSLPSRETVRITNTYNKLTDLGANSIFYAGADTGTVENQQGLRDIRYIDTIKANGRPRVYRNEDTGWIWPPYFKYDSSNLQARATDLKSTAEAPKWVSVTAYGWRVGWLTIFPNAISLKPVAGPDVRPLNWAALVILGVLGLLLVLLWRIWAQFRERTIDPAVRRADETWDRLDARADAARDRLSSEAGEARGRIRGWLDTWRGKPRR
ncbi:DUF1523 family protein [Paracoccus suum]|uniref:DUF1523 family protein n=1 Tax=Paracoccus suum TaxID=2259340 RepID=A0A344PJI0_9RHOB|nr:DUF1523 family protein [Paracoccus suum]AXC49535.1 DUF1523 family protein [Paracoccus suum]